MKIAMLILAVWISALRVAAQPADAVKLAILSDSDSTAKIADVLTADLSRQKNLQLLERAEIEKVYREQQLSAANRDYLKMGKVMGASGLLLLESVSIGTNQLLNARLIAVRTGVVLISERAPMPAADPGGWADGYVPHIKLLLAKLSVGQGDAVPISIVNFRSAFQNPEGIEMERNLTLLLTDRLSQEQRVFVLERRSMQSLTVEKDLNPIDDTSFSNGSYLLEGTIDRDGYSPDIATINARLVPPNGGAAIIIDVTGKRANLSGLVVQLAGNILDKLRVEPSSLPWKPAEEASQYENEANWAVRWKLYGAAQSASESAWALGKRTPALASLRIRSTLESMKADQAWMSSNIRPVVPNANLILPAIRTLNLYCDETALVATNPAALNIEWLGLGVDALHASANVLNRFYDGAEFRPGNEVPLTELRDATRHLAANLDAQTKPFDELRVQYSKGKMPSQDHGSFYATLRICEDLSATEWKQGGVWHEHPEDSLPFFRGLVESRGPPKNLPGMVGWTWDDQKRVPEVMKQFIAELSQSTNTRVRTAACFLSVLRTPNDGTDHLRTATQKLVDVLWDRRKELLDNLDTMPLLEETEKALAEKYGNPWSEPFRAEPWAGFRQRMRVYFLSESGNVNSNLRYQLFPADRKNFTAAEAAELLPLMREAHKKNPKEGLIDYANMLADVAERPQVATDSKPKPPEYQPPAGAHQQVVTVNFQPWPAPSPPPHPEMLPERLRVIYRGGKLWSMVGYAHPNGTYMSGYSPVSFVCADVENGHAETIVPPQTLGIPKEILMGRVEEKGYPNTGFDVGHDSLFASFPGKLARYRFATGNWATIPLPTEACGYVVVRDGMVYFADATVLLEINPGTKAIQTLASSRRRPAENVLDSMWGPENAVLPDWGTGLAVATAKVLFRFDLSTRTWDKMDRPQVPYPSRNARFLGRNSFGILSWSEAMRPRRTRLLAFTPGRSSPELLLEHGNAATNKPAGGASPEERPKWEWPEPFPLDLPSYVLDGENLWALQTRLTDLFFNRQELVGFKDDRTATLLRFGSGSRQPLAVPLRFEKNGQTVDPSSAAPMHTFPAAWNGFATGVPEWLVTDKGVVVVGMDHTLGHWLIPASEMERRWAAFQNTASGKP